MKQVMSVGVPVNGLVTGREWWHYWHQGRADQSHPIKATRIVQVSLLVCRGCTPAEGCARKNVETQTEVPCTHERKAAAKKKCGDSD